MSRRAWLIWAGLTALVVGVGLLEAWTESYCWFGDDCATVLAAPLRRIAVGDTLRWLLLLHSGGLAWYGWHHRRLVLAAVGAAALVAAFWPLRAWLQSRQAPEYYTILRHQQVTPAYQLEPIKRAGPAIGPYLLRSVRASQAPERRLALDGLGRLEYRAAAPMLDSILRNPNEPDFIRADALKALQQLGGPDAALAVRRFHQQAAHDPAARLVERKVKHWARLK